jgi:hypothetical protein
LQSECCARGVIFLNDNYILAHLADGPSHDCTANAAHYNWRARIHQAIGKSHPRALSLSNRRGIIEEFPAFFSAQ